MIDNLKKILPNEIAQEIDEYDKAQNHIIETDKRNEFNT